MFSSPLENLEPGVVAAPDKISASAQFLIVTETMVVILALVTCCAERISILLVHDGRNFNNGN